MSAFAARTDTGLVQDELRGDGTAGLYHLSRAPIVIGSDKLRIEVRDRFEITRVVESRELSRFIDYDLDYERGTVFFKEPVQNRDQELNPIFIVVDYEVRTGGEDQTAAGLRVAAKFADERLEIGASAVYEGAQAGDTSIAGADLTWRATDGDARARRSRAVAIRRSAAPRFLDRVAGGRHSTFPNTSKPAPGRGKPRAASASASSSPPTPARAAPASTRATSSTRNSW